MSKEAWKAAREALDIIEDERRALLEPTRERLEEAQERLTVIEETCGSFIGYCECGEPIFEGERYHVGSDVYLCEPCAPAYADMLASPQNFRGLDDDETMTPDEAKAIVDAHLAAGGSLDDKMVSA